ncbi:MAG: LysR family transcriptional regulator [Thomasclavelia sp.]|uniref:LysR family transcriptional regulator n=1 Tax=Thomasclavelia sp. TaxID=3025757 RepID=UPI0039A1D052
MNLRHLLIFKTVVDTGSFTKAAKKLFITQSGVSHAIRELELQTNTVLFDRLSKTITLTPSGKLLFEKVIPILALYHDLEKQIDNLEMSAPIKIVSSITIATFWLPKILKQFEKHYPDIKVEVQVVSAKEALAVLENGEADLALIEGVVPPGPFIIKGFSSYQLNVLCAPDYFDANEITLRDLCTKDLLLREQGSATRDIIDSYLYLQGLVAYPKWTSVNSKALIEACIAGFGFTVLPTMLVAEEIKCGILKAVETEVALYNKTLLLYHQDKYLNEALVKLISIIESEK